MATAEDFGNKYLVFVTMNHFVISSNGCDAAHFAQVLKG